MTRAMFRALKFLPALSLLTACASLPDDSSKAVYHDSAFNDHNRAPASMNPPVASYDGSVRIDPTYMRTQADYHYAVGEAASLEGNRQAAIESFKSVLIYDPDSVAVRLRLSTEYLKAGFLSESVTQAEEALRLDAKNIDARLLLGGLYSTMKVYDKAVEQYEAVLKQNPSNLEAPLYLGAVWSEQKDYEKAVKAFEKLARNPDYPTPHLAWYYSGRVRLEQGDAKSLKASEKAFEKALELKPSHTESVLALGSLYNKQGKEDKAVGVMAKFQKEQGNNARVAEVLAQFYIEKGKFDEAFEQLEVLENNGDDPLSAKLKMALILIERKMFAQATVKLEEILTEAPDSDKVRFYLGAVYEESKDDDKAILHFKKILPDSQYYEESIVHAAYLMKGRGKLDDAISLIEGALTRKIEQPQVYAMYASLLDEKGQFAKAAKSLESALERFTDNAQLRFYYGTIQDRLGNKAKVIEQMKKVIDLDPNHVQGLNYLAFTWAEGEGNLDEAETLARRASELDPQDGYILDTLGWILLKKGDIKESVKWLEAAYRQQPTVSIIAEHLGDAYMKVSLVDKAVEMYNKAIQLESDNGKIRELRSKITAASRQELPRGMRTPSSYEGP